ncbi:MAG: hypothetical protein RTU30_10205 [Candidatus Thorarchaeota archaeon]
MTLTLDEAMEKYKPGIDYLKSTGLDLIVVTDLFRTVFQPGSMYESEKEILAKPFTSRDYTMSIEFMERFSVTTEVDLERLVRMASIILTNFSGPDTEEAPKKHFQRLVERLKQEPGNMEREVTMVQSFLIVDRVFEFGKPLRVSVYTDAVRTLAQHYRIWT